MQEVFEIKIFQDVLGWYIAAKAAYSVTVFHGLDGVEGQK